MEETPQKLNLLGFMNKRNATDSVAPKPATPKPSQARGPYKKHGISPDEKQKAPKKARKAKDAPPVTPQKPKEAAPLAIAERAAEYSKDVEVTSADFDEAALSFAERVEAAAAAWASKSSEALVSCPRSLSFSRVAEAIEIKSTSGDLGFRALSDIARSVMCSSDSSQRRANLAGFITVLSNTGCSRKAVKHAMEEAFGVKVKDTGTEMVEGRRENAVEANLADIAQAARQKQRTLFSASALLVSAVASVCEQPDTQDASPTKDGAQHMTKLLVQSGAKHREVFHLVNVLLGAPIRQRVLIKVLAHALAHMTATKEGLFEAMVHLEDAIDQAWGERGAADKGVFADALLQAASSTSIDNARATLVRHCSLTCGLPVIPMHPRMPDADPLAIPRVLEQLGSCAVLAEWHLIGERAQVHVDGTEIKIFDTFGALLDTERRAQVAKVIRDNLHDLARSCVLEVLLMKPLKKVNKGEEEDTEMDEDAAQDSAEVKGSTAPCTDMEVGTDGEAVRAQAVVEERTHAVVVFDILALNGISLAQQSLRGRRQVLLKTITPSATMRIPPSIELPVASNGLDAVKLELNNAISAFHSLSPSHTDKVFSRAKGLVLKRLDGPSSQYCAVRCSSWQAVSKPPHISGPEADRLLFEQLTATERAHIPPKEELLFGVVSGMRTGTEEGRQDCVKVETMFKAAGVTPKWFVDSKPGSVEAYRALGLDAIVAGKLIPARNMVLEEAAATGKICVQISDDISAWEYYLPDFENFDNVATTEGKRKRPTLQEANGMSKRVDCLLISPVAAAQFMVAKLRGCPEPRPQLAGVYPLTNLGQSLRSDTFTRRNFILGDFFVVDKSPCRFDETMSLKEDYFLTCRHLETHGSIMRCNHLIIHAKHETNAGGACAIRDSDGQRERDNIKILRDRWPGAFPDNPLRPNQVKLRWDWYQSRLKGQSCADANDDADEDDS